MPTGERDRSRGGGRRRSPASTTVSYGYDRRQGASVSLPGGDLRLYESPRSYVSL